MSQADFNCDCVDSNDNQTLAQLRRRMMIRLGYAVQADNPPPGMATEIDEFLQSAQRTLYQKNSAFRTERLYRWTMTPGVSYYGIRDNDGETDFTDITCGKHLDEYGVHWVGLQDLNNMWMPLRAGIDPTYYTTAEQEGLPQLYEIRSCIEVFPVPNAAYKLWIKGRFGIEPFTANTDRTTIDSELVFLHALANAKARRGQQDAAAVQNEATAYLVDLIAGKHTTRRYIPGKRPIPPAVQPVMDQYVPPGS